MCIAETCVWIWFNSWFFLVRDIWWRLIPAPSLRGSKNWSPFRTVHARLTDIEVSGSGYGHNHFIFDLVVHLWGWEPPLFGQATGHFSVSCVNNSQGDHLLIQRRGWSVSFERGMWGGILYSFSSFELPEYCQVGGRCKFFICIRHCDINYVVRLALS